jgi:clan AA aspartic protease (TIGR02281 family)
MLLLIIPLWAVVAVGAEPADEAMSRSPEAVLRERRLVASGHVFVLPEEAEISRRAAELRGLYRAFTAASSKRQRSDRGLARDRGEIRTLQDERSRLGALLAQLGSAREYNQVVARINDLSAQVATLRDRQEPTQSEDETTAPRERCLQAALNLRALVDRTRDEYAAIAADTDVRYAFVDLNRDPTDVWRLGPTLEFRSAVQMLQQVEAAVVSDSVNLARKGGVFWVDTTFNGRVTRPLVFDTGAACVVLPASMAAEIGLKPGPGDPVVRARVADGSEVPARQMVIPSLRVGRFTVANVECIVMPAGKKQVPPLLGQSFHKHFTYTFTPDSGKLVLSPIDPPGNSRP